MNAFKERCFWGLKKWSRLKPQVLKHYDRRQVFGQKFHAQYDWTTGVPDNGNEWRKFRAVPCLYPLRALVCTLFNKGGKRRALRLRGAGGGSCPLCGGTFARSFSVPKNNDFDTQLFRILDGQNRAIVIAESLASIIVAIRITSVRWRSYLPLKHRIWSS